MKMLILLTLLGLLSLVSSLTLNKYSNRLSTSSLLARRLRLSMINYHDNDVKQDIITSSSSSSSSSKSKWWKTALVSLSILGTSLGGLSNSAIAADTVAVGKCLLQKCQKELAMCILNPKCFANVICLNTCNDRADEADCQIKCGDLFENEVVGVFNACAVSQKKCVPQKQNEGLWPLPAKESMVKSFNTRIWNGKEGDGRWYITAGLNKDFDIFDCQVHFFNSQGPGKFFAKLFWRVTEPDGEFFTKNALQKFVQDPKNPAHMINHDNEYLHYKDDWYIIDYEPNDFVLVYYQGSNDAWDGYGGAFLYQREPKVRPDLIPRLEKAVDSMGLKYKWSDFTLTDNSCKELSQSPIALREEYAKKILITEEEQLQNQLTQLRTAAVNTIDTDEKEALKSLEFLEKQVLAFEKEIAEDVVSIKNEVVKDLAAVEKEVEKDIFGK